MKVHFTGVVKDAIGYGEFARNFIYGLHKADVDLSVGMLTFEKQHGDFGEVGKLCDKLMLKTRRPDVNIVNMIPKVFHNFKQKGAFNIGFTMFEASRIPDIWVKQCNAMDAILVPCEWNREVFKASGVKVPIGVANPPLDHKYYKDQEPTVKRAIKEFTFYSIFQWTDRKNPLKLIEAYWREFEGDKDVRLVLKTYRNGFSPAEFDIIKKEILRLKVKLKLKHYPAIVPVFRKLSSQEMLNLHLNNDCFVLPSSAEGWGYPYMEAMAVGNPVIGTAFSGNMDFMNDKNSYLLKNIAQEPVSDKMWVGPFYDPANMTWAGIDVSELRRNIRFVREHSAESSKIGQQAQLDIREKFKPEVCGKNLIEAVKGVM